MGVAIEESKLVVEILNGIPERFDGLIRALFALGNDDKQFTFELLKIRCEQEERRYTQREKFTLSKSEAEALVVNRT